LERALYRVWYLIRALFVAAYLGMGTVYLLARTRFGYFAAATIFGGGLFALLSPARLTREGHPAPESAVVVVIAFATLAAVVVAYVTWRHRRLVGHAAMTSVLVASLVVTVLVLSASIAAPGHALDPATGVPAGTPIPEHIRVLSGPLSPRVAPARRERARAWTAALARAGDAPHRARRFHPRDHERPEPFRHHLVVLSG
jgi:hypothetical protein